MKFNENVEFSTSNGMLFKFNDEDTVIEFKCSTFTGKEKVEVNGRILSESRGFKKYTEHPFSVNGHNYLLILEAKSLLKGDIECSLIKDNKALKKYKLIYLRSKANFWLRHLPPITGGLLVGYGYISQAISLTVAIILFIVTIIISVWLNKNNWECEVLES